MDGAYRRHRPEDVEGFTELARQAFPAFAERIECFGADWLGRQFAADLGRVAAGRPQVLMLEPIYASSNASHPKSVRHSRR